MQAISVKGMWWYLPDQISLIPPAIPPFMLDKVGTFWMATDHYKPESLEFSMIFGLYWMLSHKILASPTGNDATTKNPIRNNLLPKRQGFCVSPICLTCDSLVNIKAIEINTYKETLKNQIPVRIPVWDYSTAFDFKSHRESLRAIG